MELSVLIHMAYTNNTHENQMVATAKTSSTRNVMSALLYISTLPYLSITVNKAIVIDIWPKVVRNQASQWTELLNPIIRMTW